MSGFTDVKLYPYRPTVTSDLEALEGDCSTSLYEYWLSKKTAGTAPDWSNFKLMDLYAIAPVMTVIDVVDKDDAGKLRYRFMGTRIVEYRRHRRNPDLTGKTFAEGERAYDPSAMADAYMASIKTATPVLMKGEYRTESAYGTHDRLILPWQIDGEIARLTTALDRFSVD